MDPLSLSTIELFKKNKLAGHFNYVRPGEVVPHFFSRGSYFLSRDEKTHELTGTLNSCLHRGFKLISERTKLKPNQPIGCKFHNWTYEQNGTLLSTPGYDPIQILTADVKSCLQKIRLTDVGGLFFETNSLRSIEDIKTLFDLLPNFEKDLSIADYTFDQESVTFYPCNWQTFMEVYIDAYHHKIAHKNGLGSFLTDDVKWFAGAETLINVIDIAPSNSATSFGWSKFSEELAQVGWENDWGAVFCTIFPGLMIEFFPYVMVISQLVPISDKMTANYLQIYYHPKVKDNYNFQNAFGDAYSETASETGPLLEMLEDGRTGLWAGQPRDWNQRDSYNSLETGLLYLKSWIERNLYQK